MGTVPEGFLVYMRACTTYPFPGHHYSFFCYHSYIYLEQLGCDRNTLLCKQSKESDRLYYNYSSLIHIQSSGYGSHTSPCMATIKFNLVP